MQSIIRGWRPYVLLTLICALLYVPGITQVPPLDRDESRFVQATRQMMVSDDYVTIWFQDQPRHKKPVGIHWLQAGAVELLSHPQATAVWPYRLVSVIGATAAVLLTFFFGASFFDRRVALVGAGILATTLMLTAEAHQAKTDAVLLATAVAALGAFGRFYLQGKGAAKAATTAWTAILFWLALGVSIMIKGPVVLMIVLLTMITVAVADRAIGWLQGLRPALGIILVLAVVLPWYLAVQEATDGAFLGEAVGGDLLPKLLSGQESHGAPPGYYVLLATVTFWPGSLFLWPALYRGWKERTAPAVRYLLAWIVPAWIVFELVPTKLPHYTLPLYPALALLVASTLFAVRGPAYDWLASRPAKAWYMVWALVGLLLAGASLALPIMYGDGFAWWSLPLAAVALAASAWPLVQVFRRRFLNAMAGAAALAGALYVGVFTLLLPALTDLQVSPRLVTAFDRALPGRAHPLVSAGYSEPSLVFLAGTETQLTSGEGAARLLAEHPEAVVAVERRQDEAFRRTLAETGGPEVVAVETVEGFNYSRGQPVSITLYRAAGGHGG